MYVGYSHCGEQCGESKKTKHRTTIRPSHSTAGHICGENHHVKRSMHPNVHCSAIYNSQNTDATYIFISRGMEIRRYTYRQWNMAQS